MSILRISNELSKFIFTEACKLDLNLSLTNSREFNFLINTVKKILEQNHYIIVRNIGFNNSKQMFEYFVKQFGNFYGMVEYTDIKLDCNYTGCNFSYIELHNDDAIDLLNQPLLGFIQIKKEDPLKLPKNGIVKINDLVRYLEVYKPLLLEELLNTKIPMLSRGINYDDTNKDVIEINESLIYIEDNKYLVRFDLTRIKYYYKFYNKKQNERESLLIDEFLKYAKLFRKEFYLEEGDILIHNNKTTLHDRTECSLELNIDGTFNSREIFVSFSR